MRRGLGQSLGPVAPSSVGQSPSDSPAGADSDQASWTWANWSDKLAEAVGFLGPATTGATGASASKSSSPDKLGKETAERGSGKGGGGEGGSGSSRRQTPSNSLGTSLPGDSLHAHIAQVEAKGRSEDTLLSPDSFSVLEPCGLPPAFPRPPLPNALLAQQQQKQPQKQTQEQKQAVAEAAAAKRAEEARLKRVEAEAARVEKERLRKKEKEKEKEKEERLRLQQQLKQEHDQQQQQQQEQQQQQQQAKTQEELREIFEEQERKRKKEEKESGNLSPLPATAWAQNGSSLLPSVNESFGAPSIAGLVGPSQDLSYTSFKSEAGKKTRAAAPQPPWAQWESPPPAPVDRERDGREKELVRHQIAGALGLGGVGNTKNTPVRQQHQQQQQQQQQEAGAERGGDASVAASILLADGTAAGTAAMVRCMRKGHGALECPVCLQLFNAPVTPVGAECKCTFCEGCFTNLVQFGGRCVKCKRGLPRDPSLWERNVEVEGAVEEFKAQGGEEAELATLLTGLKTKPRAPVYRMLDASELRLDPKPLASGAYGQVFKGIWLKNNRPIACKKVLRTSVMSREQTLDSFRKEVEILAMLDHPHVLKLYGAVLDDDNICIVTELVPGGSLFDLIHTKPLLKPEAVIAISTGVCKGMTYLHSMGIIHRDLKPGNLLMGAVASPSGPQLVVKVADFGLARVQDAARTMTGGIGTSQYTAPEVLRSERYDTKADVFSFGVILWEIHARKIPYRSAEHEMNQMQIAVAVATQDHRPPAPKHCPAPFWHLMQHCWQSKPAERPSFPEVLGQLEDMQFVFNLAASAHTSLQSLQRPPVPAQPPPPQQVQQPQVVGRMQQMQISEPRVPGQSPSPHQSPQAMSESHTPYASRSPSQEYDPSGSPQGVRGGSPHVATPPPGAGGQRVLRVPAEYGSICEAIAAARSDDQIAVSAGHYIEAVEVQSKVLEIIGADSMQNILLDAPAGASALTIQGGYVRIRNMMLRSDSGAPTVRMLRGRISVEDCNISCGKIGISAVDACHCDIKRSVLCRCDRQGLYLGANAVAVLESCSVFENGDHGILAVQEGASIQMARCMVSYNQGAALAIDQGARAKVENNDLRNNVSGPCLVGVQSQHLVSVTGNLTA